MGITAAIILKGRFCEDNEDSFSCSSLLYKNKSSPSRAIHDQRKETSGDSGKVKSNSGFLTSIGAVSTTVGFRAGELSGLCSAMKPEAL